MRLILGLGVCAGPVETPVLVPNLAAGFHVENVDTTENFPFFRWKFPEIFPFRQGTLPNSLEITSVGDGAPVSPEVEDALMRIEQRLAEQEASFRHVLTMLIEWLEDDTSREAA